MPWGTSGGFPAESYPGATPYFPGMFKVITDIDLGTWKWDGVDTWYMPRESEQLPYRGLVQSNSPPASPDPMPVDWDAVIGGAPYVAIWYHQGGSPAFVDRDDNPISTYPLSFPGFAPTFDYPYGDPNYGLTGFRYGKVLSTDDLDVVVPGGYPAPWQQVSDFDWGLAGYTNLGDLQVSFFGGEYGVRDALAFPFGSAIFGDTGWLPSPAAPAEFAADPAHIILWKADDLRALNPALRWVTTIGFVDAELVNYGFTSGDARDGTKLVPQLGGFSSGVTLVIAKFYPGGVQVL